MRRTGLIVLFLLIAAVLATWVAAVHDRLAPRSLFAEPKRAEQPAPRIASAQPAAKREPDSLPMPAQGPAVPVVDGDANDDRTETALPAEGRDPFVSYHPLVDRTLSLQQKDAELAPDLGDAIVRIEGIHDPTRIGVLGPALRMQIRPGTVSMTNVFGDRFRRADLDPNVHFKVRSIAEGWLYAPPRGCEGFTRFRPDDGVLALDAMSPADCARIVRARRRSLLAVAYQPVAAAPTSLPVFAAPYAGGRFNPQQLRDIQEARRQAARQRLWFKRRPALPVFFRPDPVTGRPTRRPSSIPPP